MRPCMRTVSASPSRWCRWAPPSSCTANASARLPCRFQQRNYKHSAVIFGPTPLTGRDIDVPDLRGGFSHLIAALAAKGPSNVQGISLIDRGYADFRGKLEALGADFD